MSKTYKKEKEPKKATEDMLNSIRSQAVDYTTSLQSDKPISYIMCKEGIVEVRKTKIGRFARMHTKLTEKDNSVLFHFMQNSPGKLESANKIPLFQLLLPKIPINILLEIVQFFRAVHEKQGTEAAALIRWSMAENKYYVEIPGGPDDAFQDLGGTSVKYKPDSNNKDPIAMDIHSHHTMSPFFSGTDDNDEQDTQLFAVVGHIECSQPAVNIRARMGGQDLVHPKTEDIFEVPKFDRKWMETIRKPIPVCTTPYYGNWNDTPVRGSLHGGFPEDWEEKLDASDKTSNTQPYKGYCGVGEHSRSDVPEEQDTKGTPTYLPGQDHQDTNFQSALDDLWQVVETEIYDRPELFCEQEAIEEAKTFIIKMFESMSAKDIMEFYRGDPKGSPPLPEEL